MRMKFNPITGQFDLVGSSSSGPTTQAPKLIVTFDTDVGTSVKDLVKVNGSSSVTKISNNTESEIPNGIFGIVVGKPTSIRADVLFVGAVPGFSGFSIGAPVFVSATGTLTQTRPTTGISQQIGFAISATEVFIQILTPLSQS